MSHAQDLSLPVIDPASPPDFQSPTKRIYQPDDVGRFLASTAYRDIGLFILQLNHAVCPRQPAGSSTPTIFPLGSKSTRTASIRSCQTLLFRIRDLIDKAPPAPGSQRFGNVSFRKWFALLQEELDTLLNDGLLGETLRIGNGHAKDEVASYLLGSFGSSQRLDYGTGHELNFVAFLGCLWKLGHFKDGIQGGDIEREIVLLVIQPYLEIVRQLITTYTLEPAGSHGVWGLDDHSFIPYIFGSAQLTRPINSEVEPMPTDGSVRGAPKPSDVTNASIVESMRQVNMYFSAVAFINDVKKGPFWEHSPMLFDISGIKDGWGKINKGMIKMFNAEVLSKFPVIQHFPFGSLFSWDENREALEHSIGAVVHPFTLLLQLGCRGSALPQPLFLRSF
ncbi:Phosphotyrosyl phosphatase activator [Trichoderma longibrachiatum ATCC 18648]|uniref:Serine/threonine-protein phosphatase 2A activator n=1 Tax=Trichoderma longibrachiatum ATCC 18648 TaxID=983965 RepID=A0A2T4C4Z0_TRILO|nr:Phosphotyrosyl phosphatase activator [Trichoderma longibrachiatum ATCC 18648]